MKSISRKKFVDQMWGAADLDAAAEFWMRLYEVEAKKRGYSRIRRQTLEIRLSGYARQDAASVHKELERRSSESDLTDIVFHEEADTIAISSNNTARDAAPPRALGLAMLSGEQFEGLPVEIRFCVSSKEVKSSLVIVGELRGNAILVKAAWRSGSGAWEDRSQVDRNRDEELILSGLTEFRSSREVSARVAKRVHKARSVDRMSGQILQVISVPHDRCRIPGLLWRFTVIVCGLVASLWLISYLILNEAWIGLGVLGLVLFIPGVLAVIFLVIEGLIWWGINRVLKRLFARYYDEAAFASVSPDEARTWFDDPAVRKYVSELDAAGFSHLGDFEIQQREEHGRVLRVFGAPDGVSYLVLSCHQFISVTPETRVYSWPQVVLCGAEMHFTEGGRIEFSSGNGFWKRRVGPNIFLRHVQDVDDPIEFFRNFQAEAEKFAKERGLTPARHVSFSDFVRRQQAIHEEERHEYLDHPPGLSDRFRFYLQWPRKELRG